MTRFAKAPRLSTAFFAVLALAAIVVRAQEQGPARPAAGAPVQVDGDDIGGVVTGPKGREAGVWVVAETKDLPTTFARIVVTDDRGRYLLPDLPKATYGVWVRGYGLVDSPKVSAAPGKILNLTARVAPSAAAAAEYYPASYWYSLVRVPAAAEFPGTGPTGNGISPSMKSQDQWLAQMKSGEAPACWSCHQLGNKATREISKNLGTFDSSVEAWTRRLQSGQAAFDMFAGINRFGPKRAFAMFADWTDRIAAGELPPAPPRPQGAERNIVVTLWDWADPKAYLHDEIATDKRNPTINANGPIYGAAELSTDYVPVLDPVTHTVSRIQVPVRDANTTVVAGKPLQPSVHWGTETLWTSKSHVHNPMIDHRGRVWLTSRIRNDANPSFCQNGAEHPSAKLFPIKESIRQLSVYDPKTKQFELIDTCFSTHHLQFAEDANQTLWTSSCAEGCGGNPNVVGWLDTKVWDETKDVRKAQGWTGIVIDANGNGRRDAFAEVNEPIDPARDKRIDAPLYAVIPNPVDGSIWGAVLRYPGALVRIVPGSDPSSTALAEVYETPWNAAQASMRGFGPRGIDIDRDGVVWTGLSSGHLASFDRRKCKAALNGPKATGQHCPEGWTLHAMPGPQFKNVTGSGSTEAPYYNWVDQFDTFGLGKNVPIATGNGNDALLALVNGKWVVLRVPYPLGFYSKGLDGRIDDPKAGWKGRGLWSTYATRAPFHTETGKGTPPKVVKFQLRPDPLAH
jgi:hypothetical protein